MKLATVLVIARKDLTDVLRDRRTLVFMLLLPIVVMPLLMLGGSRFMMRQMEARQSRVLRVAADAGTANTVRALRDVWYQHHAAALAALFARLGLDAAGGVEGLGALLARVEQAEARSDGEAGGDVAADDAALAAVVSGLESLTEEQAGLLKASRSVGGLLDRIEFVDPAELSVEGRLADGVEIPAGLPATLADPRVALAIQGKLVEAGLHLPADAMSVLDESPEALRFSELTDLSSGLLYDASGFNLLTRVAGQRPVPVHLLFDSSISLSDEAKDRWTEFVEALAHFQLDLRVEQAGLSRDFPEAITLNEADVATASRRVQALLGGLLPYMLFAFCFFGALYPALDVTAGEKERFTLETLLLAPTSRLEIALGKFLVVFLAAIVAAVLTTASMVVTFTHGILPAELMATFDVEFQPLALLLTGSLILPVAALYAGALLAVGLCARSFKEAQSYTVPLQFLFVLPTMVSLIPDLEAEAYLAWIPFVNISLLMKELLKGNYLWEFYVVTLASTVALTAGTLLLASWLFRRESVLLRT